MKEYENIMKKAIKLNSYLGIDVYFCMNGETEVLALSVMQNKSLIYQNRIFLKNRKEKLKEYVEHLDKMLEVAECGENIIAME